MTPEDAQRERIRQITRRQFLLDRDIITKEAFVTDGDVERAIDDLDWKEQRILSRRVRHRIDVFDEMMEDTRTTYETSHIDAEDLTVELDELPPCLKGECE